MAGDDGGAVDNPGATAQALLSPDPGSAPTDAPPDMLPGAVSPAVSPRASSPVVSGGAGAGAGAGADVDVGAGAGADAGGATPPVALQAQASQSIVLAPVVSESPAPAAGDDVAVAEPDDDAADATGAAPPPPMRDADDDDDEDDDGGDAGSDAGSGDEGAAEDAANEQGGGAGESKSASEDTKVDLPRLPKDVKKAMKQEKKTLNLLYAYEVQLNPKAQTYLYQPYNYRYTKILLLVQSFVHMRVGGAHQQLCHRSRYNKIIALAFKLILVLVALFVVPTATVSGLPLYVGSALVFLNLLFVAVLRPFQDGAEDFMDSTFVVTGVGVWNPVH